MRSPVRFGHRVQAELARPGLRKLFAGAARSGPHVYSSWRISVEVVPQHLGTAGVAQLGHGLGLDLPDPLPRDAVDLADLIEGLGLAIGQAESHRHHTGLPLREGDRKSVV